MQINIGKRNSGKTTHLIRKSAATSDVIVCRCSRTARLIKDRAKAMGYNIPNPISYDNFIRKDWLGGDRNMKFMIDDAHDLLSYMGNYRITEITMSV